MATEAIYSYGIIDLGGAQNESALLVQSVDITPERSKKAFKGANKATQGLQYYDPILVFKIDAIYRSEALVNGALTGLGNQGPGTLVTTLANHVGTPYGFEATEGIMVLEDASRKTDTENPWMASFTVRQYPFVVA